MYDPAKARYCMDECERYVASARLGEDRESLEADWEEKVSRYICLFSLKYPVPSILNVICFTVYF